MNLKTFTAAMLLTLSLTFTLSAEFPPIPSCGPCDPVAPSVVKAEDFPPIPSCGPCDPSVNVAFTAQK